MTNWKTYKLSEITIMRNGKKRPKNKGVYPVYGGNGIMDYADCFNAENTIIVGRVGAYCGNVYQCKSKCWVSDNAISVSPNELADSDYLYYLMASLDFHHHHIGGAQPLMTQDIIGGFKISLPSLEEQRKIAGILGALDDKIENNRRINTNLESQAQALYKQWFVDFEFPNEEGKPYKSSGGKMVESELGPIPEEWRVGDIYKYVNVVYGAPYKSALFNERKDGNPLIRIRDLKTFSPQYYTQEILPNTEYVNAGDVVAGMDAEFVPCLWMGEKGVLNQRCCKFVGKQDSISNYYVMFLVKPELEFVQSYKTGTTVSHLGKADIDKFVVVYPPFAVIEKFSKIADALLNNKIKLAKENISLATLRDTLLPKLMNGEIKL